MLPADAPRAFVDLLQRWQSIVATRLPSEADFPFADLVGEHPGLGLIEPAVSPEGRPDYRYCRVGPEHESRTGRALEGSFYSDVLYAACIQRVLQAYGEIQSSGQPHYWDSINLVHGSRPLAYGRLMLPLFADDQKVRHLLGCWIWRDGVEPD